MGCVHAVPSSSAVGTEGGWTDGSTEWGEQFADELRNKAVAYINVDEATSGPNFHGQAVASLAPMLVETSRTLNDPAGKSLTTRGSRRSSKRDEKETSRANSAVPASLMTLSPTPASAADLITPYS